MTKKELLRELENAETRIELLKFSIEDECKQNEEKTEIIKGLSATIEKYEAEKNARKVPMFEGAFIDWLKTSNGYVLKYYEGVGVLEHIDRLTYDRGTHELYVVVRNKPIKYKVFITEYRKADGSLFEQGGAVMELTKIEASICYCSNKYYYTFLLKEHYEEAEKHGNGSELYKMQSEEMQAILVLQKKLFNFVNFEGGKK